MKKAPSIVLTSVERQHLERWSLAMDVLESRRAMAAKIVLLAAENVANRDIAVRLRTTRKAVGRCRRRFAERRLESIACEPLRGPGKTRKRDRIAAKLAHECELGHMAEAGRDVGALAAALHCSPATLRRAAKQNGIELPRKRHGSARRREDQR